VVARASAGASELIPTAIAETTQAAADFFRSKGLRVAVAAKDRAESIYEADLSGPLFLVIGGEKRGVTRSFEDAADMRLADLDPHFLASCFDNDTMQTALFLQPEPFAAILLDALLPLYGDGAFAGVCDRAKPAIRLANAHEVIVRPYSGPVYRAMRQGWHTVPPNASATTAP